MKQEHLPWVASPSQRHPVLPFDRTVAQLAEIFERDEVSLLAELQVLERAGIAMLAPDGSGQWRTAPEW